MPEFQLKLMDDFCLDDLKQISKQYEKDNPLIEEEIAEIKLYAANFLNKAKTIASRGYYSCAFDVLKRFLFVETFVQYIQNHGYKTVVTEDSYIGYNQHLYPRIYNIKIYWGNI